MAPSNRLRASLMLASVPLLLLAGVLMLRAGGDAASTPPTERPTLFERQAWMKAEPDDGSREEMLEDLLQRFLKPGMTRRETEALLGKPGPGDRHPCLQPLPDGAVDSACYTVSVGMDPCTFLLGFDAAGRFVRGIKDCS